MRVNKILVVDDEASVRHVLRKMLGDKYLVFEAADGQMALDIARQQQPDLIFMDIMMPKMDGYSVASELKSNQATKHIPVVMLTALNQDLNKKYAELIGTSGYITKPFRQQDLLDKIDQLAKSIKLNSRNHTH